MATLNYKAKKYFILGKTQILAVTTFNKDLNLKLTEYDYPYAQGIDYEDRGEGIVEFTLEGYLMNFENVGRKSITMMKDIEQEILDQKKVKSIKFAHPEIGAFNVKVKNFKISQTGDLEPSGYTFTMTLCKVTPVREIQRTQVSLENEFDSGQQKGEGTFTVKSGDTLWGKALQFYGQGLLWKKIWNYSDNIAKSRSKNPNLIYPGEIFKYPIK